MTKFSDITFTMTDVIKGLVLLGVLVPMWIDLKTDRIKISSEMNLMKYQITELQRAYDIAKKCTKNDKE